MSIQLLLCWVLIVSSFVLPLMLLTPLHFSWSSANVPKSSQCEPLCHIQGLLCISTYSPYLLRSSASDEGKAESTWWFLPQIKENEKQMCNNMPRKHLLFLTTIQDEGLPMQRRLSSRAGSCWEWIPWWISQTMKAEPRSPA